MAKRILKYPIDVNGMKLKLPISSKILHVGIEKGKLQLWAVVDDKEPDVEVEIEIYGDGYEIKKKEGSLWHLASVMVPEIEYTCHVFLRGELHGLQSLLKQ